jgi:hypothetical protein
MGIQILKFVSTSLLLIMWFFTFQDLNVRSKKNLFTGILFGITGGLFINLLPFF